MAASQIKQNNPNKRSVRFLMFDVSPDGANLWFDISNFVLLAGAVLVAFGTYGTIKFAGIKERFSDERIATNEKETKRAVAESDKANAALGVAQADIAKAQAQIAGANARALEAQAALEKYKAPRILNHEQQATFIAEMRKFGGQKFSLNVFSNAESIALLNTIKSLLIQAGWILLPPQVGDLETNGAGVSNNSGISVGVMLDAPNEMARRASILAALLTYLDLPATPNQTLGLKIPDAINIIVGQKPQ